MFLFKPAFSQLM